MKKITGNSDIKIVFVLLDGVGDLPHPDLEGKTPLEAAITPNMDRLARNGSMGQVISVGKGIAPESDIAVFNMLGYKFEHINYAGRGVIEAIGVGIDFQDGDLALRGNFATLDKEERIIDRRAGRDFEREDLNLDVVCLSSIAGIRGRKKNMYYSATKAGLNSFLSSLRQKCHKKKIRIFTVLPGYVDTRMISNLSPPKLLVVSPKRICNKIVRSLERNQQIIYPNFIWKIVSLTLRLIPEKVFKTLKF